jgi:hypothetical protein
MHFYPHKKSEHGCSPIKPAFQSSLEQSRVVGWDERLYPPFFIGENY